MADESTDHEKTLLPSTLSGMSSPRRAIGGSNSSNNSSGNGCIAPSTDSVNPNHSDSPAVSVISNESSAMSRASTTTGGVVAMASSSLTATTSMAASSAWTSPLETGGASVTTSAPGGIGGGGGVNVSSTYGGAGAKNNGDISPRSPKFPRKSRVKLSELQLESATREEWAAKWREQDLYIECLEAQVAAQEGELACLRDSEEKYRQQCFEVSHRERILMRRLASKEQQLLGYANQITEMRGSQTPTTLALRSALLDPAVNILIQKLRQELLSTKAKLEDTQNELSAWKFTPDSNTGKRLMAKCRLLYQENEELGRMIASGRIAKLEGELLLQKSFSEEVKKSQSELDEFLQDLDEDVEGMQSTIYFLQQELRKARESVSLLQQENNGYKAMSIVTTPSSLPQQAPPMPLDSSNPLNGVVSMSHANLVSKVEPTDSETDFGARSLEDTKLIDPVKKEASVDGRGGRCADEASSTPASPLQLTPMVSSSTMLSTIDKKSASPDFDRGHNRLEEQDESSNDSAALIIKVENEELSDREDSEDVVATSETQAPQRAPRMTVRESAKADNAIASSRSNGDDRTSRPTSRRLLRERTAKRDAQESDEERPTHKKKRRESILSLDYTETDDDALLFTNGENLQSDPEDGP